MLPETFVAGFHDEAAVRRMPYSRLGRTGLHVSKLGLGGAIFSNLFGEMSEEKSIQTIREALRQGVNYIDTAPYYGMGRSEEILGKALKGVPRQAYYIATKVSRYEENSKLTFDFSPERTAKSIDNSLRLLGLPYVDIIQIHDVDNAPSQEYVQKQTLPALKKAVKEGKARFVGITGYHLTFLKDIVTKDPDVATILNYARNTLVDSTLKEYVPFFKERDVGVISAADVMMGMLTNSGPQPWHPAPPEIKEAARQAREHCRSAGVELADLAVHHSFSLEGAATHLLGVGTRQLLSNTLRVIRDGLTDQEQAALQHVNKRFFAPLKVRHWEGVRH